MKLPNTSADYRNAIMKPFNYWMMMGIKLPSILFWGIKIEELNDVKCVVKIPFKFTTQNPFKSIYFSALNGAAELSTGIPIQMLLCDLGSASMLVTGFEATFLKKASTDTRFVCNDVDKLKQALSTLNAANPALKIDMNATGLNESNEEVCKMKVHWSIKLRTNS